MPAVPGDLIYANEKFSVALDIMATTEGSLRERLLDAYVSQAHHADPFRPGLGPPISDGLAERIARFDTLMTATPATRGEGTIRATVDSFTDEQVRVAARELSDLAGAIRDELQNARS